MARKHPDLIDVSEVLANFFSFDPICSGELESGENIGGDIVVEQIRCELPFEMAEGMTETGELWLAGAPPTQSLETTVMPVWHRLQFRIERDENDGQ